MIVSSIAELRLEQLERELDKLLGDRRVHEGILQMCQDMVDEDPSLRYTILGNIILSHKEQIKTNDIQIQYLQKELKMLAFGVEFSYDENV